MPNLIKSYIKKDKQGRSRKYGIFLCYKCRNEFEARMERFNIMTGNCKKCADIESGKKRVVHGFNNKNSRLHVTWANMKRRCLNPTDKEKKIYKNINLCSEWMEFKPFMDWSINNGYSDKKTIDRIDNTKGYNPENCRFVDSSVQAANRKITEANTSGYIGVSPEYGRWRSQVSWKRKTYRFGRHKDKMAAVILRDLFIINNKLPHQLNLKTEEIKYLKQKYAKLINESSEKL